MNEDAVTRYVNSIVSLARDNAAEPVLADALDTVFRPYMVWLVKAHRERANPSLVRATMLAITSLMIMEMATRMTGREPNGDKTNIEVWLGEFMLDLRDELVEDMNRQVSEH